MNLPVIRKGNGMNKKSNRDSADALVQAAINYVETHSVEKFSLKALSEALFINSSYLLRLFKSRTGQTLLNYHNRVRCEKAQKCEYKGELVLSNYGKEFSGELSPWEAVILKGE